MTTDTDLQRMMDDGCPNFQIEDFQPYNLAELLAKFEIV
ncbi:hypothetical protein FRUB_04195 [Fimbriiglobus ruber]|uniref:Uncharacterized protein n=1 Tax=Fimbriiglobus ruber TaxID=1908690 RepID=A0A225E176_9BACT|nr:hypothetical protein FRUB_04195 [Fimbriiglobus ruber]